MSTFTLFSSCKEGSLFNKSEPLSINFEIEQDSETSPATITIINETSGANKYLWSFEGGMPSSSTEKNPGPIYYEEAGSYTVTLEANSDVARYVTSRYFRLEQGLSADFEIAVSSDSAPAEVNITNNSKAATTYNWSFPGGIPASSSEKNPSPILYAEKGSYAITLEVGNETSTKTVTKEFELNVQLKADFTIDVSNTTAPAEVNITNNSKNASSYIWSFIGGSPSSSTAENPSTIIYTENGDFTIELQASNGTATDTIYKNFSLSTDEIISYQNITLGGVDLESSVGAVFSTASGEIIKSGDITSENGPTIDIAFVGRAGIQFFYSPQNVSNWGLTEIPNATNTDYINYLESSGVDFSVETFDAMTDDSAFRDLTIQDDEESFPSNGLPRIVLFENAKGKKGAIKITEIISGNSGQITFDLKVQK